MMILFVVFGVFHEKGSLIMICHVKPPGYHQPEHDYSGYLLHINGSMLIFIMSLLLSCVFALPFFSFSVFLLH